MCVCVCVCACVCLPLCKNNMLFKVNFLAVCYYTKVKQPSVSYYSSTAGRRRDRWILFPRVLALSETLTASSRT